jgi:hypothetical protein
MPPGSWFIEARVGGGPLQASPYSVEDHGLRFTAVDDDLCLVATGTLAHRQHAEPLRLHLDEQYGAELLIIHDRISYEFLGCVHPTSNEKESSDA